MRKKHAFRLNEEEASFFQFNIQDIFQRVANRPKNLKPRTLNSKSETLHVATAHKKFC